MRRCRLVVRAALVVTADACVALLLGRWLTGVLVAAAPADQRSGPAALDAWVGPVAAVAALVALGWWATSFALAVAAQARATLRSGARPVTPASASPAAPGASRTPAPSVARRLAAAALGVALTGGPVAAHAAVDRPAADDHAPTVGSVDRPAGPGAPGAPGAPPAPTAVVVRPGDTLWTLAAARLGDVDRPDPRVVAAAWPRWWHANRAVVGPDPDLIRPGQVLHPPTVPEEDR